MRNINFSSSSSESLTRSSALRRQLHDQSLFLPSNSLVNSNSTVQDYRFLPKPTTRVEDNNLYSNLNQSSYNSNSKQTISGLLRSPINGLSKNPKDLRNSFVEKNAEKSIKYVKTPYPQAYKADSYLRNEIHPPSQGSHLPLLPPSRLSFQSEARRTINRLSDSATKYSLVSNGYDLQRDTQTCRKRNLQQVYKQKSEQEHEEEEFHDAISDDDDINGESVNNPNKKPNILPLQRRTYNQTPSTAAQTGLIGTQNNTPNKPTNTYGLPLSMIDDDYKLDPAPTYNFSDDKLQDTQKQTSILGLTQYSHPYNFPKASFLPTNTEVSSKNAPSSVQRIRTPLRYRSSLLGALSNRTNSSCRILSAAEMKKVFCKSKKPIGSLKDFVHTIEIRKETFSEPNTNSELPKVVESHSEIKHTIEEKATKNIKDSHPEEDSKHNKEDVSSSRSESDNQSKLELSNILTTNAKKSILPEKSGKDKEPVEKTSNVDNLTTSSSNTFGNYDSKLSVQSEQDNTTVITSNSSEITVEKKDTSQETKEVVSEDFSLKNKDSGVSETKKDESVPWWLANVNKPNLVEVDNEGVFMPDEEDDEPKNKEEKPTVSAAGLFSLPSTGVPTDNNIPASSFSFANTSTTSTSVSTGNSLFGPSLFQINKISENSTTSEEQKPEEKAPILPVPSSQSNNFSFNQSTDCNISNNVSLFGINSNTVEGEKTTIGELEKPVSKTVISVEKDSSLQPQLSIFGNQSRVDEEKKQAENPEKKTEIFGTDNLGSLFTSTNNDTGNLFSQQNSSMNQLFGSSNASNSTQNAFNSKDIFDLSTSETSTAIDNSEKKGVSAPIFGSSSMENKNSVSDVSFPGSSGLSNLKSSSNISFAGGNTNPQTNLQAGLLDSKLINFGGNSNPSTIASTSLFGGSNPSNSNLGLGNSLFSTPTNNNTMISGLFQNPNIANNTNVSSTTPLNSIFGVQQISASNTNSTQNTLNFDSSIGGVNNSIAGSTNNINIFSQAPSIFGSNNGSNPFVFGSNNNKPNDQTITQAPGQNLGQSSGSNIFGSAQGIFNSTSKTETSIFGGMNSNPVTSQFDTKPQVPGQSSMNTSIFGSNPPNLLSTSTLIGNNSNPNPFVGHSSNPAGGTSHRRRIARAKRSH
ncbi:spm1 [Cryptosporidium sp. chipmunk genotype I]|uniref:spm1 n=1 Tax=Cryptosporidium sp. chipmunk genotype I TaxID=1280935 RepID=UPI00351A7C82|nr:spm1 [Cryptosporidium sp. chipmunk genotype I]